MKSKSKMVLRMKEKLITLLPIWHFQSILEGTWQLLEEGGKRCWEKWYAHHTETWCITLRLASPESELLGYPKNCSSPSVIASTDPLKRRIRLKKTIVFMIMKEIFSLRVHRTLRWRGRRHKLCRNRDATPFEGIHSSPAKADPQKGNWRWHFPK
jgi:hypothetical protein